MAEMRIEGNRKFGGLMKTRSKPAATLILSSSCCQFLARPMASFQSRNGSAAFRAVKA
jgi:hypothetical protein